MAPCPDETETGARRSADRRGGGCVGDPGVRRAGPGVRPPRSGRQAGPCYPGQRLDAAANLYLNAVENDRTFRDDAGLVDYEMPFINYASGVDYDPDLTQGYADDNWTDGTQSYVYSFTSPGVVEQGYGLTTTMVHEGGHHLGLAHPHDGYDSETGVGYEATGDYYFAWLGDQSNTVMSYIDLNWDFSQFDRDNSNRFLAAAYVEGANRLAADVLRTGKAAASLANADARIGEVEQAFANHDYQYAYDLAEDAYAIVVRAAGKAGTDPAAAAKALHTRAEQARIAGARHDGEQFIDTLSPGQSPRSLP